ncbi:MAG: hypothetical protein HFG01_10900 [Oscillibacter sp.]|nr:hypothetical protein [Oscillibacter sp.]
MERSGFFHTNIRGPASKIRKLPGLPKKWFAALPGDRQTPQAERERNVLTGTMKDAADICGRWWGPAYTNRSDTTGLPLLYLDFLEYAARSLPELEIAVVVNITDRETGHTYERSYYSPAGENTLHPDGLAEQPPVNRVPGHPYWVFPPEALEWIGFQ